MDSHKQVVKAVGVWIGKLSEIPGWRAWKDQSLANAVWLRDDEPTMRKEIGDWEFEGAFGQEHAIITSYYALISTVTSLKDCEYYFRRYPFYGLPVSKDEHLRYIFEMYFGRFYEFSERMKKCSDMVQKHKGNRSSKVFGKLIKDFKNEFDEEIRERHHVHHHDRFEDVRIHNLALTKAAFIDHNIEASWKSAYDRAYRKTVVEMVDQVRVRSGHVEEYLNAMATVILAECPFLC